MRVGLLGATGIDPHKKYTLKTLPNRPDMVGLEFLAYYYVTWAKVFPEQIDGLGLPYKQAYENALAMFQSHRGKCAARNGIILVKQMKQLITALCMAYAAAAFASARVEVPTLPQGEYADAEMSTNVALNVSAARLERLTFSVAFEPSETNEVLVALGADTDGNGDLSIVEADVVFGCDCGAWYRADLRTGETTQQTTNVLVIGKREFDPSWNLFKVIRRGFGEIGESVTLDEERARFDIRVR